MTRMNTAGPANKKQPWSMATKTVSIAFVQVIEINYQDYVLGIEMVKFEIS